MKNLSFLVLTVALAIGVVSCGGKDSGGSSSSGFSSDPYKVSTVKGYLNVQQPIAVVGNQTYTISQQSYNIMSQAFQQAQQQNIQPTMVNGAQMYKANITGSVGQQGTYQQGGQQAGYPQQGGNVLNVTQAVIYR
jgi:hypothetical protein